MNEHTNSGRLGWLPKALTLPVALPSRSFNDRGRGAAMDRKQQYLEKLRDPRWQKLRLEILERDGWKCQQCYATDKTLHVHHIAYQDDDPWETEADLLLTLCLECHAGEGAEHRLSVVSILGLLSRAGIKTSFQLDMLRSAIDTAWCDQRTGNWAAAWGEGMRKYLAGYPFNENA